VGRTPSPECNPELFRPGNHRLDGRVDTKGLLVGDRTSLGMEAQIPDSNANASDKEPGLTCETVMSP
jgi:hypothetical protein